MHSTHLSLKETKKINEKNGLNNTTQKKKKKKKKAFALWLSGNKLDQYP